MNRLHVEYWDDGNGISFTITSFGPFTKTFLKQIKNDVPPSHRAYFPRENRFWISEAFKKHVISIIEHINTNPQQTNLFKKMKGQDHESKTNQASDKNCTKRKLDLP